MKKQKRVSPIGTSVVAVLVAIVALAVLLSQGPTGAGAGGLQADLQVTKEDVLDPVPSGGEVTYRLAARNGSGGLATNVVLTDTLPEGLEFVSTQAKIGEASCSHEDQVVTCALGDMGVSTDIVVLVVASAMRDGEFENTASITSETPDPDPSNNTDSESTTVGKSSGNETVPLFEGWNGITWSTTIDLEGVSIIVETLGNLVQPNVWAAIARYDGAAWQVTHSDAPLPSFNTLTSIDSNQFYWLNVNGEAELTIPGP